MGKIVIDGLIILGVIIIGICCQKILNKLTETENWIKKIKKGG